jgi:hypothetical protein
MRHKMWGKMYFKGRNDHTNVIISMPWVDFLAESVRHTEVRDAAMARPLHKLSDASCRASKPGLLSDGGGLYLNVRDTGTKSWVFVWKKTQVVQGKHEPKRYEMGLGPYPAIRLSKAREMAAACERRSPNDETLLKNVIVTRRRRSASA